MKLNEFIEELIQLEEQGKGGYEVVGTAKNGSRYCVEPDNIRVMRGYILLD